MHAFLVNAVTEAGPNVRLDGDAGLLEGGFGPGQGLHGQQRIGLAVGQQHRRARANLGVQQMATGQHAGMADDAGHRGFSPEAHVQRHHGALGKADEQQAVGAEAVGGQGFVDEGVQDGRRRDDTGKLAFGA